MLKKRFLLTLLAFCVFVTSCRLPASPEKYFDTAALNANAVSHFGSDYFITALGYGKRPMSMGSGATQYNYEQQIGFAIQRVEGYLKNVNGLMPTKDTKTLLDASKELFQFTLESYRTDHLPIARLIDKKAPPEEIASAMEALDKKSYEAFLARYDKLHNIGIQYAKDNQIPLAEMPTFNR